MNSATMMRSSFPVTGGPGTGQGPTSMNDYQFSDLLIKHHIRLNSQQVKAVEAVDGPTLLLAVPGSGKTTTLIARIGYMVFCRGIDPASILTLTYTVAATRDMQRRFEEIFGARMPDTQVRFQTINSLCNGIIDEYVRQTRGSKFDLAADTTPVISQLYRRVYDDFPTEGDIGEAKRVISYIKNMRLSEEERANLMIGEQKAEPLYRVYQEQMRRSRMMDFDDQLTISMQILAKYPRIRQQFREQYPYILVDEAQDTSRIQHDIIGLLAGESPNLFMVGDEDQSIYGFRAAYPQALLEFEEKYENARVLYLEENYRSTPQIVTPAGRFIAVNRKRRPKHMVTGRAVGARIRLIELDSRYGQYAYLMKCLADGEKDAEAGAESGARAGARGSVQAETGSTTAILMRNNDSAIPLIYYLRKNGIPYRSRGMETTFFTHRAVRDVKDFAAFAQDPADADVFLRIYYKTGLMIRREHARETVRQFDPDMDRGLFHTYLRIYGTAKNRERIRKVIDEFDALRQDYAWEAIGRIEFKLRNTGDTDREKFFILRVLAEHGEPIYNYFQKLDWLRDVMTETSSDPGSRLFISTVHSSKGLEYDEVYIIDAVDGILPAADAEDMEEERRIFYVAMTRAKDRLNIMCYKDREMPFVDVLRAAIQGPVRAGASGSGGEPAGRAPGGRTTGVVKTDQASEYAPAEAYYHLNDRVRHTVMGEGTVVELDREKVIVRFDSGKQSKLLAQYCTENGMMVKI